MMQSAIKIIKQFRIICPQCGELPESPYETWVGARNAQRRHWQDHRDGRI